MGASLMNLSAIEASQLAGLAARHLPAASSTVLQEV